MLVLQIIVLPFVEIRNGIVWWYGAGLRWMNRWLFREFRWVGEREHLGQWVANLFTPMYGDASWQGRLISFFIRSIVIAYRFVWTVLWSILHTAIWGAYALLPPLAIGMLVKSFL